MASEPGALLSPMEASRKLTQLAGGRAMVSKVQILVSSQNPSSPVLKHPCVEMQAPALSGDVSFVKGPTEGSPTSPDMIGRSPVRLWFSSFTLC